MKYKTTTSSTMERMLPWCFHCTQHSARNPWPLPTRPLPWIRFVQFYKPKFTLWALLRHFVRNRFIPYI